MRIIEQDNKFMLPFFFLEILKYKVHAMQNSPFRFFLLYRVERLLKPRKKFSLFIHDLEPWKKIPYLILDFFDGLAGFF
jgi:hypothetical protein